MNPRNDPGIVRGNKVHGKTCVDADLGAVELRDSFLHGNFRERILLEGEFYDVLGERTGRSRD